jgi:hypothetical protein
VIQLRKTSIDGAPALVGEAVFPDRPQSDEALKDVQAGLLNSVSIGFRAMEVGPPQVAGQHGSTYLKTRLLEISLVTLPACQTCLVTSKSACQCDDVLPQAPSDSYYAVDRLSHMLASHVGKSLAPVAWEVLDDGEKDATPEMVNALLGKTVSAVVIETVKREVRAKILYLCGRVD